MACCVVGSSGAACVFAAVHFCRLWLGVLYKFLFVVCRLISSAVLCPKFGGHRFALFC